MAGDAGGHPPASAQAASAVREIASFFCQIEAVETAIWLAEVASDRASAGIKIWMHLPVWIWGIAVYDLSATLFLRGSG
jgi:hypothetical protein